MDVNYLAAVWVAASSVLVRLVVFEFFGTELSVRYTLLYQVFTPMPYICLHTECNRCDQRVQFTCKFNGGAQ